MSTESNKQVELSKDQVIAWANKHKVSSGFAANLNPDHFIGYTELELDGIAEDRDALSEEIGDQGDQGDDPSRQETEAGDPGDAPRREEW